MFPEAEVGECYSRRDWSFQCALTNGNVAINLYNSVYERGAPEEVGSGALAVTTYSSSEDTSLLDMTTEPPTPTGALVDAGDPAYGTGIDFWGTPRTGNPDLGAVESP